MLDTLIRGGLIIDGTGAPAFQADIGIRDGKLTLLPHNCASTEAGQVIDATGKYICPGFIDAHSHADRFCGNMDHNLAKTSQGITTEVTGHCGISLFPTAKDPKLYAQQVAGFSLYKTLPKEVTASYEAFRNYYSQAPKTTNIKQLAAHGAIREAVMGLENRPATAQELSQMEALLQECMEHGTAGVTSGLIYPPGTFTPKEELVAMCKVAARYGGIYTSHIRDEGDGLIEAVTEALEIAKESGCRLTLSHHKAAGHRNWGKTKTTLEMIDKANSEGMDVALDVYPYTASMTSLYVLLPKEEFAYPVPQRVERLQQPQIRKALADAMRSGRVPRFNQLRSLEDVLLISCPGTPEMGGKTVAQVGALWNMDPIDALFDLLVKNRFTATAAFFTMCQEDLCRVFCHERTMLCTDALVSNTTEPTHPRSFCAFPQAIDYFVRQKKLMSLEKAISKMTAIPAAWYRIQNKGQIQNGYDADLVIFDYDNLAPGFTYGEPIKCCPGIEKVLVNGIVTYENGNLTGKTPGIILP